MRNRKLRLTVVIASGGIVLLAPSLWRNAHPSPAQRKMDQLILRLQSPDWRVRAAAADALHGMGSAAAPTVPRVMALLNSNDDGIRASAALTLGDIGPAAAPAIPVLTGLLKDPDTQTRVGAAQSLGKMGPAGVVAVPALLIALHDKEYNVRYTAATAFGNIGPGAASAAPALVAMRHNKNPIHRMEAAWALVEIIEATQKTVPKMGPAEVAQSLALWQDAQTLIHSMGQRGTVVPGEFCQVDDAAQHLVDALRQAKRNLPALDTDP